MSLPLPTCSLAGLHAERYCLLSRPLELTPFKWITKLSVWIKQNRRPNRQNGPADNGVDTLELVSASRNLLTWAVSWIWTAETIAAGMRVAGALMCATCDKQAARANLNLSAGCYTKAPRMARLLKRSHWTQLANRRHTGSPRVAAWPTRGRAAGQPANV